MHSQLGLSTPIGQNPELCHGIPLLSPVAVLRGSTLLGDGAKSTYNYKILPRHATCLRETGIKSDTGKSYRREGDTIAKVSLVNEVGKGKQTSANRQSMRRVFGCPSTGCGLPTLSTGTEPCQSHEDYRPLSRQ